MERQSDYPGESKREIAAIFGVLAVIIAFLAIGAALLLSALDIGGKSGSISADFTDTTATTGTTKSAPADTPLEADRSAMDGALSAQAAIERYAAENTDTFTAASPSLLRQIDSSLYLHPFTVESTPDSYVITVRSTTGSLFLVADTSGKITKPCKPPGTGGCPADGTWG